MYIPERFRVDDETLQDDFMHENPFGVLTTVVDGEVVASHLPFELYWEDGVRVLRGHMARANPQWQSFEQGAPATVIFSGAHGYVSPTWYDTAPAVPTWNYMALHAYGKVMPMRGPHLRRLLAATAQTFEGPDGWRYEAMAPDYQARMEAHIVGFQVIVSRVETQFKLSQNRSAADRQRVIAALAGSTRAGDRLLAAEMARLAG